MPQGLDWGQCYHKYRMIVLHSQLFMLVVPSRSMKTMGLIHNDVTKTKWPRYLGEICIKTMETSNEFILSDSCGRFREEGTGMKDTNNGKYNQYSYFRKEEYSKAGF